MVLHLSTKLLPKQKYRNHREKFGPHMAHIWEWYGKADSDLEFVWCQTLANFKVREMYGKKRRCFLMYGRAMGIHYT